MKITGDDDYYPDPDPPSNKTMLWAIGIGLWVLIPILLLQLTWVNNNEGVWIVFVSIGLAIAAAKICGAAGRADEKHAKNMSYRASAREAHLKHEQNRIAIRNARREADERAYIERQRRETEAAQLETQRRETEARRRMIEVAEQQGLNVDQTYGVNEYKYVKDIDRRIGQDDKKFDFALDMKRKEIDQYLERDNVHLQLSAADAVDYYRIIDQLENELEELMVKRRRVELDETDEVLKGQKLARMNERIKRIEDDINARQANHNRLLSSQNGQDPRRIT